MSKRPWYKRYPADFIAGTLMLTAEEKGAYSVLIDLMYDRGGPIPDDPRWLAPTIGKDCSVRKWKAIRQRLIDLGKIKIQDDCIVNSRVENQSKTERKEHENFVNSGRTGGEKNGRPNKNNDLAEKWLEPSQYSKALASQKLDSITNLEASALNTARETRDDRAAADAKQTAIAVEVGKKVTDLMGVTDDPRWLGNWSLVQAWLNEGFSPEADILPTVATIVQKFKRNGKPMPKSLNYFTAAIRENNQIRRGSGVSPVNPNAGAEFTEVKAGTPAFRAWIAHWRNRGQKTIWLEQQRSITVPTEYPQTEKTS